MRTPNVLVPMESLFRPPRACSHSCRAGGGKRSFIYRCVVSVRHKSTQRDPDTCNRTPFAGTENNSELPFILKIIRIENRRSIRLQVLNLRCTYKHIAIQCDFHQKRKCSAQTLSPLSLCIEPSTLNRCHM